MYAAVAVERADNIVLFFHGTANFPQKYFSGGDDAELHIILTDTPVHFLFEVVSNGVERGYAGVFLDVFVFIEVIVPADNVPDAAKFLPGKFVDAILA